MSDQAQQDRSGLEAAALNAAIEARAHRRRCPICSGSSTLCDIGRQLLGRADTAIRALGDDFAARGRVAKTL